MWYHYHREELDEKMKKFLFLFAALMLVVVTGCGKTNSLKCTYEDDEQKAVYEMEFDKNDEISTLKMTTSMKLEEELTDEETEQMKSYMSLMCMGFDYEGSKCDVEVEKNAVNLVISIDMTKLTDEEKAELSYNAEDGSLEAMKKAAEDEGFTCK